MSGMYAQPYEEVDVALATKYAKCGAKPLSPMQSIKDSRTDGLNGVREPAYEIKKENHNHRAMLYLAAAGHNIREIAGITGYCPLHVGTIVKQDWFQKQLTRLLEESGKPVIDQLFAGEVKNSLETILALRDNPEAPANVRMNCAFNILDRVLGKPVQKSENINHNFSRTSTMSMEELEKEEARLKTEELRLRGA